MGIPKQMLKLFLHENNHKNFSGDLITFGKQTVGINNRTLLDIFAEYKIDVPESHLSENRNLDTNTRHRHQTIDDASLFKLIGDVTYNCMDVSGYEGANIIHDLNQPVAPALENSFDLVFTGGCLDNVFNPVSLLFNSSKLLRTGGRVFHYESFKGVLGAYLYFSPEWFYSYYAINNFSDVRVYVCHQTEGGRDRFDYDVDLYLWQPEFSRNPDFNYFDSAMTASGIMYCMVVAEKGEASTCEQTPIQLQYLDSSGCPDWRRYKPADRTPLQPSLRADVSPPFNSDHFIYCGSAF